MPVKVKGCTKALATRVIKTAALADKSAGVAAEVIFLNSNHAFYVTKIDLLFIEVCATADVDIDIGNLTSGNAYGDAKGIGAVSCAANTVAPLVFTPFTLPKNIPLVLTVTASSGTGTFWTFVHGHPVDSDYAPIRG